MLEVASTIGVAVNDPQKLSQVVQRPEERYDDEPEELDTQKWW